MYEELSAPLPDGRAYAERIGLPWPLRPDLETLLIGNGPTACTRGCGKCAGSA